MLARTGVALASLLLAACLVGDDYERPELSVPEVHRGQELAVASSPGLADLVWWEVFGDEQLQALVATALAENEDLAIAAERVLEARALYRVARGELFPELGLGASGSSSQFSEEVLAPGADDSVEVVSAGVDLSYEIDLWGRVRRSTEAARADVLATEEARRTVVTTLISDVARSYFELRELDLELEITRRTLASRQASLDLVSLRQSGGVSSMLDVRQAEAERSATAARVPQLERAIALKENAISVLLGRNPDAVPRGRALLGQPLAPALPPDAPAALLQRRPDVRQAEARLVSANARAGEAEALLYPQLNLFGFLGREATGITGLRDGDATSAFIQGTLSQWLFDGGRLEGNLEAAESRFRQALLDYERSLRQALREVSDALTTTETLRAEAVEQRVQVEVLLDAVRLAGARYKGGVSSYLEVLDTERALFTAEIGLARIERDQLVAVVQLYRALGGGWATEEPTPAAVGFELQEPAP